LKKHNLRGSLFIIILFCLAACQSNITKNSDFLYLRLNSNPTTLDPALIVDVTGSSIAAKIFNGLITFDPNLNLQPDIAKKWTVSPDGTIYTFYLQRGVKFSNGREITAHDFKYSFERVLNPNTRSPRTWVLDHIRGAREYMRGEATDVSGIQVKNTYRLEIILENPFGPFLSLLSLTTAYVVPKEEVERWGPDFSFHVVGSGPFLLKEWRHGRELCLIPNPFYFSQPAGMKGIFYRIIPEELTSMVEFEIGNLDIIQISAAEFRRYIDHPEWKPYITPREGLNTYYLGLNCQRPPFNDVRIRQAIGFAIDRKKILATIFENRGLPAHSPIPPILRRSMPPLQDHQNYNPDKARELLREAGYPQGFSFHIIITALPETLDIVEVIQQYLNAVGIKTTITQLEWSSFKEMVSKGKADSFWLSWWADYPDVENFLYPLFHSANQGAGGNRTFYKNQEVDRLIESAQKARDRDSRMSSYHKAEEIIIREAPMILFWHKTDHFLHHPRVRNFMPHPLPTSEKGTEIFLAPANP